ncbi:MAG: glycosyltransferase family 39 protein [Planctomycetes bacterium]|nr:glycosyltransferase family 39 protein [Planctomycetota bacterium]
MSDSTAVRPVGAYGRRELVALGGILAVAFALRLIGLGTWAFWVDEAHSFRDVTNPWSQFWASDVSRYPLSYLLVRGLLDSGILPATTEGWLRLPFAFVGVLTVSAVAVFGRALVGNRASLVGAALLALSPWHLYWSQNVRGYALMLFLATLAVFAGHRGARDRSSLVVGAGVVLGVLAGLSHPSGFLSLAILGGVVGIELRTHLSGLRRYRRQLGGIAVVALGAGAAWLVPAIITAFEKKPGFSTVHLAQTLAWFAGVPLLVAGIGGLATVRRTRGRVDTVVLATWVLLPLVALTACSVLLKVTAQYALIVLPGLCLLAGRFAVDVADAIGTARLADRLARLVLPGVLALSFATHDFLYYTVRHGERPRWREGAQIIARDAGGASALVLTSNGPSLDYYIDRTAFWRPVGSRVAIVVVGMSPWTFANAGGAEEWLDAMTERARDEHRALYVVLTEPELGEWDLDGAFNRTVRARGHQIGRLPCWTGPKDMTVLVYRIPV